MAAIDTLCMACDDSTCHFKPVRMQRRPLAPIDVLISMKFCGVCHSDIHTAAGHLSGVGRKTEYPVVPGHELVGVVEAVGSEVTKFQVGDHIGVGCLVDSCLECEKCAAGEEQKCSKTVGTYNGVDWSGRAASYPDSSRRTRGGYTSKMVVQERFGIKIQKTYPLEKAGPVFCAGITLYDPLMAHCAKAGTRVGIVGLGGLGVMGLKLAKALGCEVTAISRLPAKEAFATVTCGADAFVASTNAQSMLDAAGSLDLVLNTIPAMHDCHVYERLLRPGGKQVILGLNANAGAAIYAAKVVGEHNCTTVFSGIGGLKRTQEVIDLCAKHDIFPEVKVVPVSELSDVYSALDASNDSGVRYVLDLEGSLTEAAFQACEQTSRRRSAPTTRASHTPGSHTPPSWPACYACSAGQPSE